MQLTVTVRPPEGGGRDVRIQAPATTAWSAVAAVLATSFPAAGRGVWIGPRRLPDDADLGRLGLRNGDVLDLGRAAARDLGSGALIRAHIAGGPVAGRAIALPRGEVTIGRAATCAIAIADPQLSREHAVIVVNGIGVNVRDLGSTNGTRVDGRPLGSSSEPLAPGAHVQLGDTTIQVVTTDDPAAALRPGTDGTVLLTRALRAMPLPVADPMALPVPPGRDRRHRSGLLAALVPAFAGAAIAVVTHQLVFLALSLAGPLAFAASAVTDRWRERRTARRTGVTYAISRRDAIATRAARRQLEQHERRRAHPDPAALLRSASIPDVRIWERRRNDGDFLDIRLGLADQPGRYAPDGAVDHGEPVGDALSVPVVLNLRSGALGICGPRRISLAIARWSAAQLVALHSPADVEIVVLADDEHRPDWSWLRWLGHLSIVDPSVLITRSAEPADRPCSRRWTVLIVDGPEGDEAAAVGRLLELGARAGVSAICIGEHHSGLPLACATMATVTGDLGSRLRVEGSPIDFVADQVDRTWAETISRALGPLDDPSREVGAAIPVECRLLDLPAFDGGSAAAIAESWKRGGSPRAVLGIGLDGPLTVDLALDGPHALIAGTTGAGKSELLRSLVVGLALSNSPSDLAFILIDYKGGATFAECATLPHTVGLVTDLDAHLTRRALRSLAGELRRRERLFATAGVAEYADYRRSHGRLPLGRLVIVVDEFAALADELPQLLGGLLAIAQRGRSLGIHLVLATQRPGGVVSPEIQANVSLRIALRVTDPADSSAVIGSAAAAAIDKALPGRALVRTATTLREVQTVQVSASRAERPSVEVTLLDEWHQAIISSPSEPGGPSDLSIVVDRIRAAAALGGLERPPSPWLPPLPHHVELTDLDPASTSPLLAAGLVDRPDDQRQEPLLIDLQTGGSLLVAGPGGSGRTTVLRTIAAGRSGQHVFAIDCAGGGLAELAALSHCGAVLTRDDPEAIGRLLTRIRDEVADRLGNDARPRPPLVLLLDGWETFSAVSDDHDAGLLVDQVAALVRDAPSAGLTVAVTGGRAALSSRALAAVDRTFVLAPPGSELAQLAGIQLRPDAGRGPATNWPPGRALQSPEGYEVQFAVASVAVASVAVASVAVATEPHTIDGLIRVRALPRRLRPRELPPLPRGRPGQVQLGRAGDGADAVTVDLFEGGRWLVAGPPRSGRSGALSLMLRQLHAAGVATAVAAEERSPLARLARELGLDPITPTAGRPAPSSTRPLVALIDDVDAFAESCAAPVLLELAQQAGDGSVAVVISGRSDEVAATYHGLTALVRRSRTGILLQPTAADGDLLGVRLPRTRSTLPPGRGVLVCQQATLTALAHGQVALPIQLAFEPPGQPMCG